MPQDANHLIWIDMEMTGLKPEIDRIIEVALVVTDSELATIAEAPVLVVHQDDATLAGMDSWNQGTHAPLRPDRQGQGVDARRGARSRRACSRSCASTCRPRISPMCGNTICQDRRFLARWMPALEDYFHYRNLDVSTLKELCKRWQPDVAQGRG